MRDERRTGLQAPLAPFGLCYRAGVRDRVPPTARLVAAFVCVIAGAGRATATEPELESLVVGPSTCPRPELVLAELATLLPPDRLSTRLRALTGAPAVELIDLGVPFQVVVGGRVREYRDEARDCTQRARVAAVFVAMTIDPASIAGVPRPAAARADRDRDRRARAARRALRRGGSRRRGRHRQRSRRAGRTGAAGGGRATAARVRRRRDRAVAGRHPHRRRAPSPVAAARRRRRPLPVRGRPPRTVRRAGRVRRGAVRARAGSGGGEQPHDDRAGRARRARVSRRCVALRTVRGAARELVPIPPEIYALPQGVAGHTPYLWIGASAGASLGFL